MNLSNNPVRTCINWVWRWMIPPVSLTEKKNHDLSQHFCCSFFWFSSQFIFTQLSFFLQSLKIMLIHDYFSSVTAWHSYDVSWFLSFFCALTKNKDTELPTATVYSENVTSIKRRGNNTLIKTSKHAGSFMTILFVWYQFYMLFLRKGFSIRFSYFSQ